MVSLSGKVVAGRGVASEHVLSSSGELDLILGGTPYPGSLNVVLERPLRLDKAAAITFDRGQRYIWTARLNGEKVGLYRWDHAPLHVAEIVAPYSLRERLNVADGAIVRLEVGDEHIKPAPLFTWALLWAGRRHWVYTHDGYQRFVGSVSRMTGLGIEPPLGVLERTARGVLRLLGFAAGNTPYRFSRLRADDPDRGRREVQQITNLLNYTKTSNSSYSAQKHPAGYHTIELNGRVIEGQRDPTIRFQAVPIDFANKSVLDLGSNQGGMLLQLADKVKWAVGVDFDHRMVNAANRIRAAKAASNLNFYVFDLQKEELGLIRDFLPDQRVDVCFLLSVCMWLKNWRDVIDFAASVSDAVLFESNGSPNQQADQIEYLRNVFPRVSLLAGESSDDPGQKQRQLLLATQ